MGLGRFLLHDFFTASEFNVMEKEFNHHRSRQDNHGLRIEQLERDLGYTTLLARALAEACLKKGVLTQEELHAMVREVDVADGRLDGRASPPPTANKTVCAACGHATPKTRPTCLYCGHEQ